MPRDDRLPGLLVGRDAERRVFVGELASADAELLLVGLGLRLDGDRDDRLGEVHRSSTIGAFSSQSVSPVRVSRRPTAAQMLPRVDLLDLLALVGVHAQEAADALALARASR